MVNQRLVCTCILRGKSEQPYQSPHDRVKTNYRWSQPDNTRRERDVLELICKQYKTSEIGEKLFICPRTVEVHRKNLLEKTGVKNIAGLVIFAINNNLIPPIIID